MTNSPIIADTGVIVSLIYEKDQWRKWAFEQTKQLAPPFDICEAVIIEACFLLHNIKDGKYIILGMITDRLLQIDFNLSIENESLFLRFRPIIAALCSRAAVFRRKPF